MVPNSTWFLLIYFIFDTMYYIWYHVLHDTMYYIFHRLYECHNKVITQSNLRARKILPLSMHGLYCIWMERIQVWAATDLLVDQHEIQSYYLFLCTYFHVIWESWLQVLSRGSDKWFTVMRLLENIFRKLIHIEVCPNINWFSIYGYWNTY